MSNEFYNDFDRENWDGSRISDYRTPFQVDRDRIVHSSAFRRLQGKTQVFIAGEYDFYRTRLTHSLEVAQIARSICEFLKASSKLLTNDYFIDADLVEAVGLTHDLGHPPFGHSGERELNVLMKNFGGFEANAQTLRLITSIIYDAGVQRSVMRRSGMSPTRAFLDGVMKYKTLQKETPDASNHFIYNDQQECLEFVLDGTTRSPHLTPGNNLNSFRSIECQIMDWADDTAYRLNDIADGIKAGFIDKTKLEDWAAGSKLTRIEATLISRLQNIISKGILSQNMSIKIGNFIRACELRKTKNFMSDRTNRYAYRLVIADENVAAEQELYKRITNELVFSSPQLHQLEIKGKAMLRSLFTVFYENYCVTEKAAILVPLELHGLLRQTTSNLKRARLICDHIAGMSDHFAIRTYRRLFDPDYGSMVDLI